MYYQTIALQLANKFLSSKENFTIINNTQDRVEENIITGFYYIIDIIELNIALICQCHYKAILRSDIKVLGTIQNDIVDVISPIFYVSYDFVNHHYGIEFKKWNQYEKCIVYSL
jgi:hypothetical protein